MNERVTALSTLPQLMTAGVLTLERNVERYIVKGGGSGVFSIERDDQVEIALIEPGQTVEVVVFSEKGKSDLSAIGLKGRGRPTGLQAILDGSGEDAQRVRFGLFRRGLDIGRAQSAVLFGPDAVAGELYSARAERAATLVIAAPSNTAALAVWDQSPPSDVLVFIRRARPAAPGLLRLPEPLAEPRLDMTIGVASAISFEVFEGEFIQIVDIAGRQCSDFLAFNRRSLDKGQVLGIDSTTTRTFTGTTYPRPGLFSKFFDKEHNPLVEVVQDTVGRHDTFGLACTNRYYEDVGYFGHANCTDNLNAAMSQFQMSGERGWPAINYFFNTNVDANNNIWFDEPWSRPGDYVLMRAMSDLVCAATSCPDDIDPINGWNLSEIQVRVYPKTASFKRAIGYRMTPDSPLQLTQETGFHSRTSALTRAFTEYRGYWLPTCYSKNGVNDEYWACRERVVIMDLSPLRKLEIMGRDVEEFLNGLVTRDVKKLGVGQVVYTPLCYEHGGMVDDGTLFRLTETNFRWIGGDDASINWIKDQAKKSGAQVSLKSASSQIHNVAVQGPKSRDTLRAIVWTPPGRPSIDELGVFRFTVGRIGGYQGIPIVLSRTGYTGELGYEVFCSPNDATAVWDSIMEAGSQHRITPMGFDALDIVRIEAGLVFGGHDFDSTTDPFEAGIGFTVPTKKEADYIGKAAILRRREHPSRKLVGLDVAGNQKPSHGDKVFIGRAEVGIVTSATKSPILNKTIALARMDVSASDIGTVVEIGRLDGHLKRLKSTIVRFPFYDPEKMRVRS